MNDIAFHPVHNTLATVGSDGRFNFWDKDVRTKLKPSEQLNMPITCCGFDHTGKIFAYAGSYDWSQVGALYVIGNCCSNFWCTDTCHHLRLYISVWVVYDCLFVLPIGK